MQQRGRKSSAALVIVDEEVTGIAQVMAPAGLSDAERQEWLALVNSRPADWFGTQHIPMMVEYVRHVCRGHVIDEQLRLFDKDWLETDDGLRRYEKFVGMALKNAGMIKTLATSMRLTQQTVYHKDKAGMGPPKAKKLWQREPS